jgi:hypothetical protein
MAAARISGVPARLDEGPDTGTDCMRVGRYPTCVVPEIHGGA